MKIKVILLFICLFAGVNLSAQTSLVQIDESGSLTYASDPDGFIIPDFSYAGYRGGGVEIPTIPVVKEISPIAGDNTSHIQAAIDEVGKRTPDANGFRGALLLKAGKYEMTGTLYVKYDGVVVRGVGNGKSETNSTIIYAKGNMPHQRDVVVVGNTMQNRWNSKISGTQKNIMDDIVPVGATSFTVSSASPYQAGDLIAIYHPCSETWLKAIDYGGVPAPSTGEADERWSENQFPIIYHRYIKKIEGNKITIDAPVFYTLNKSLSQSYVYKFNKTTIIKEVGIENLRIDIESAGGEDENHAWQAVRLRSVENAWAKNVITSGFGQSGFITDCATRTTIEDCQAVDPVSIITGERRYNFNTYVNSQLILFKDCYANNGRHHYVSNGTSSASGVVFLNCISDAVNSTNEGHRHWTQGMLYDGHKETNLKRSFVLGLYNRVDMGTGHGWAAVHSVLWNCDMTGAGIIGLQKPPTAQNYAIGCTAKSITGKPVNNSNFPVGYVELQNKPVSKIPSLYEAQLEHRQKQMSGIAIETQKRKPYTVDTLNSGSVKLSFGDVNNPISIHVFDIAGRACATYKTDKQDFLLDFTSSGIYVLKIQIDGETYSEKMIRVNR
ncbi:T9SS type A sorting domain-containing protein [Dysgonomonas sp. 520]|uniref:T9SS type A sorting domain-containing protein n=1 Tax=Dysgonomonas sp. 520 TaxID=2302931 RepID=UPI0013D0B25F|nr:T9SS type A sorting domain-containing protein [Dysgonomonas sp. 520]NDW09654.1 T9SS C-terminal target domain-containing protein [Dysgonomonas sp. 520]